MKITTIGRGTIGGTLGRLWRSAGHEVTELGRDGEIVEEYLMYDNASFMQQIGLA